MPMRLSKLTLSLSALLLLLMVAAESFGQEESPPAEVEAAVETETEAAPAPAEGTWSLVLGRFPPARATLRLQRSDDGVWSGTWRSGDVTSALAAITFDIASGALSFDASDRGLHFSGIISEEDRLEGAWTNQEHSISVRGERRTVVVADLIGYWIITTSFRGREMEATLCLYLKDGALAGRLYSEMGDTTVTDLSLKGDLLKFTQSMGGGMELLFEGHVDGDTFSGSFETSFGVFDAKAVRLVL